MRYGPLRPHDRVQPIGEILAWPARLGSWGPLGRLCCADSPRLAAPTAFDITMLSPPSIRTDSLTEAVEAIEELEEMLAMEIADSEEWETIPPAISQGWKKINVVSAEQLKDAHTF